MIDFRPISLADKAAVQDIVRDTPCRNCDLNFMNLMSWRFRYDTEIAIADGWLLLRFKVNGHTAYQAPVGQGDYRSVMLSLLDDAAAHDHPFLMLGVCDHVLTTLQSVMPEHFYATPERDYADYIYTRTSLATLAGKKLQPKRNFANRFARLYPDYRYAPLTPSDFDDCLRLEAQWTAQKEENSQRPNYAEERRSMQFVLSHWDSLDGLGGTLRIGGQLVAFTFGAAINHDTFDVCVEKADTRYEGAYAVINRDLDLGIAGLRRAKLSYHPAILLQKYTVMTKHPFASSVTTTE